MKLKTAKELCPHLRAQCDSLKGACAANTKVDFEKFENSIISLKGACAPMRDNRVCKAETFLFTQVKTVNILTLV